MAKATSASTPQAELPIDHALSLAVAGEHESALRYAAPLLEVEPRSALRLLLTAWLLGALGETEVAKRGLIVAVERASDAGNLPLAVAAACKLRDYSGDHQAALQAIAKVFAR